MQQQTILVVGAELYLGGVVEADAVAGYSVGNLLWGCAYVGEKRGGDMALCVSVTSIYRGTFDSSATETRIS